LVLGGQAAKALTAMQEQLPAPFSCGNGDTTELVSVEFAAVRQLGLPLLRVAPNSRQIRTVRTSLWLTRRANNHLVEHRVMRKVIMNKVTSDWRRWNISSSAPAAEIAAERG
jgi:hypothetical protein